MTSSNSSVAQRDLLLIENLSVQANHHGKQIPILDNVSFNIKHGEVKALIGPSGSGKTMTAFAILGLLPEHVFQDNGRIIFKDKVVGRKQDVDFYELRGKQISMIFQEPHASLNPVFKVGKQILNVFLANQDVSKQQARLGVLGILENVGLSEPEIIYNKYPHQLSGGMAQRVLIALALSCQPALLIADEPTTSLDATTQIIILKLLKELQQQHGFSMMLISHDKKVVNEMSDSIIKIDKGKLV